MKIYTNLSTNYPNNMSKKPELDNTLKMISFNQIYKCQLLIMVKSFNNVMIKKFIQQMLKNITTKLTKKDNNVFIEP